MSGIWIPLGSLFRAQPCIEQSLQQVLTVGFTVGPILFYSTQSRPTLSVPALRKLAHILMY